MSKHTNEEIINAAKTAVAAKPEGEAFIYERPNDGDCVYRDQEGNPSCLVGYILHTLEPEFFDSIPFVDEMDYGEEYTNDEPFPRLEISGTAFTDEQAEALRLAQQMQDGGDTWGHALGALAEYLLGSSSPAVDIQ